MSCLKTYYCSPNSYHKITVIQLRIWRNVKHYFPCILRLKHFYIIVWIIFKLLFRRKSFFSAIGIQLMECYISHQNVYWAHNKQKISNDVNTIECDEGLQDPIRWWPFLYLVKFTSELQVIYFQTSAWLLHRIYKLHMKYNTIILQFCAGINNDPYTICYLIFLFTRVL